MDPTCAQQTSTRGLIMKWTLTSTFTSAVTMRTRIYSHVDDIVQQVRITISCSKY